MNKLEKLAYLKGLVEGLNLNDDKKDTKVIKYLMELLEDIVLDMENLEDGFEEFQQQLDEVDEDLGAIEKDLSKRQKTSFIMKLHARLAAIRFALMKISSMWVRWSARTAEKNSNLILTTKFCGRPLLFSVKFKTS